ncbi:MAG: hypothetical protein M3N47_00805 [Chloroflexota bacterium]|nr:hypothetical protein [Chloroflexota bacterium]
MLGRLVDTTQTRSDLAAADTERIAYDEVHAQRREDRDDVPHDPAGPAPRVSASELVRVIRERNAPRRGEVLRSVASLRGSPSDCTRRPGRPDPRTVRAAAAGAAREERGRAAKTASER